MCTERSIPYMLGAGACFGTAMAAFRYTNGLSGFRQIETDEDEVERKEMLRKMRRRPLQETIEQLGEGRGERCMKSFTNADINVARHLCSRLRRAEA